MEVQIVAVQTGQLGEALEDRHALVHQGGLLGIVKLQSERAS